MDEVPSPAARRPVREDEPARAGFDGVLFGTLRAQLARTERENAELHLAVSQLNARLHKAREWARRSNASWALRQDAWHRERDELLARLDDDERRRRSA